MSDKDDAWLYAIFTWVAISHVGLFAIGLLEQLPEVMFVVVVSAALLLYIKFGLNESLTEVCPHVR